MILKFIFLLLALLSLGDARKVVGQRDAIADKEYYIPLLESRVIDSARPSELIPNSPTVRLFAGEPSRWVARFDVDSIADFWPENPVYSAFLEVYVSSSRNTEITIEKPALNGADLSALTWDCVVDTDLHDGVSVCADKQGKFPGMATKSFNYEYEIKKNQPGVKRFDITKLVRSGPEGILVRLEDEKEFQINRADDHVTIDTGLFTPRIVIVQPKANIILADSQKHPGSKVKWVTTDVRGQALTHHMFYWEAKNPFPQEECNIVVPFGVYFTAGVGFGQGELMNDRCNVYFISQHCTGLTGCVFDGYNDVEFRSEIFSDLLWFSPTGLKLPKGTYFVSQDQGSSLITHMIGWLKEQDTLHGTNKISYVGGHYDYDGWTGPFYCDPALWASGLCSRAFFPLPGMQFPSGFLQFAACSQHGNQNSTDVATSCRARMHEQWEYWAGWNLFTNPWEDSVAEADLRTQFPWLSDVNFLDPQQGGKFVWFGYENLVGPSQFVAGELEYHNSWTKPSRADYLKQRHAMSLYPDQLVIPKEYPECGPGTLNPTCDPFGMTAFDINAYVGTPIPGTPGPQKTLRYESYYSQHLTSLTGHPFDMKFWFPIKPGLGDDLDFNPTNGVQCLPENNGVLTVNGSCTGYFGSCVCGHDLIGNLGLNSSPQNIAARLAAMPTARNVSPVISPLMCHQDLRCTDNYMHVAEFIVNAHGEREREHQRLANGW